MKPLNLIDEIKRLQAKSIGMLSDCKSFVTLFCIDGDCIHYQETENGLYFTHTSTDGTTVQSLVLSTSDKQAVEIKATAAAFVDIACKNIQSIFHSACLSSNITVDDQRQLKVTVEEIVKNLRKILD